MEKAPRQGEGESEGEARRETREASPAIDWRLVARYASELLEGKWLPAPTTTAPLPQEGDPKPTAKEVAEVTRRRWGDADRITRSFAVLAARRMGMSLLEWAPVLFAQEEEGRPLGVDEALAHQLQRWFLWQTYVGWEPSTEDALRMGPDDPRWATFRVQAARRKWNPAFTSSEGWYWHLTITPPDDPSLPATIRGSQREWFFQPTRRPRNLTEALQQSLATVQSEYRHLQSASFHRFLFQSVHPLERNTKWASYALEEDASLARLFSRLRALLSPAAKEGERSLAKGLALLRYILHGTPTSLYLSPGYLRNLRDGEGVSSHHEALLWRSLIRIHEADHRWREWGHYPTPFTRQFLLADFVDIDTYLSFPLSHTERVMLVAEETRRWLMHAEGEGNGARGWSPPLANPELEEAWKRHLLQLREVMSKLREPDAGRVSLNAKAVAKVVRSFPTLFRQVVECVAEDAMSHEPIRSMLLLYGQHPNEIGARLVQVLAWLKVDRDAAITPEHLQWVRRTYPSQMDNMVLRLLAAAEVKAGGLERLADLANRFGV